MKLLGPTRSESADELKPVIARWQAAMHYSTHCVLRSCSDDDMIMNWDFCERRTNVQLVQSPRMVRTMQYTSTK